MDFTLSTCDDFSNFQVVKAVINVAKLGTFLENALTKQNMEEIKGGEVSSLDFIELSGIIIHQIFHSHAIGLDTSCDQIFPS